MKLKSYTDIGGREENEDSLCAAEKDGVRLFVVADGLGGCGNGKYASQTAVDVLENNLRIYSEDFDMRGAVLEANNAILTLQEELNSKMKSTVAAVILQKGKAVIANVGDSRIYAFKNDEIVYQSPDHSLSQMAVNSGEIKPSQIRGHVDRNVLTKALGVTDKLKFGVTELNINNIDAFLLCTDGFWEYVLERQMQKLIVKCKSKCNTMRKKVAITSAQR